MADVPHWEQAFVRAYIVSEKRDRYLNFLKGPKHRQKILERLNHSLDYEAQHATSLDPKYSTPNNLVEYLLGRGVDHTTCCLMADGNPSDGLSMRLDRAVQELLDNQWGALIICPPVPIAVYKAEGIADLMMLD